MENMKLRQTDNFKRKGLFITVEGSEGAGKSTQTAMLAEWLLHMGLNVITTREPGEGKIGSEIRKIILNPQNKEIAAKTEAFLYAADRAQHVEKMLKPALNSGAVVICDRYVDSHIAYQGYGRGLNLNFLRELNQMATGGLMPDLTILLSLDAETGLERVRARENFAAGNKGGAVNTDRIEQEQIEFHHRLCKGYAEIAKAEPNRVKVINANGNMNDINYEIRKIISGLLLVRGLMNDTNIYSQRFDRDADE